MDPRRRPTIAPVFLAALLAGCPSAGTDGEGGDTGGESWRCAEHDPAAACALGTGEERFLAVEDGDALAVYRGSQGALHVFGSLRCSGVMPGNLDDLADPDNPIVTFSIVDGDTWLGGYRSLPRPLTPTGDDGAELVGDVLPLDIDSFDELPVAPVRFSVELVDGCGARVDTEATVVLVQG